MRHEVDVVAVVATWLGCAEAFQYLRVVVAKRVRGHSGQFLDQISNVRQLEGAFDGGMAGENLLPSMSTHFQRAFSRKFSP